MISLAHGLGIDVVAEGIETEPQLTVLRGLACDRAQGYLFETAPGGRARGPAGRGTRHATGAGSAGSAPQPREPAGG